MAGESPEVTRSRDRAEDEDFNPVGTAVLVLLYFLALVLMWVVTYFVEFLGNQPTPTMIA